MVRNLSIAGSSGSIGRQTLDIVRANRDMFSVKALSVRDNIEVLAAQIEEFRPQVVSVASDVQRTGLMNLVRPQIRPEILTGREGLKEIAAYSESNTLVMALVGITGLIPTIAAVQSGKYIALANKETLVTGGSLIMPMLNEYKSTLIPVDSEHSAILQCIGSNDADSIKKILITASGGPFRTWSKDEIAASTAQQALNHPNWVMGQKVTIDSATLMNKVLEIIEAKWLFNLDFKDIQIVIHPQSIVHSMVEFADGAIIAQMSNPSMHIPIQYALFYPERRPCDLVNPLNLFEIANLEFYKPDNNLFPCVDLLDQVQYLTGTYSTVLNAANEIAVEAFINNQCGFYDIHRVIMSALESHEAISEPTLEDILDSDDWAREFSKNALISKGGQSPSAV